MYNANISAVSLVNFEYALRDIHGIVKCQLMDETIIHKENVSVEEAIKWMSKGEAVVICDDSSELHRFYPIYDTEYRTYRIKYSTKQSTQLL